MKRAFTIITLVTVCVVAVVICACSSSSTESETPIANEWVNNIANWVPRDTETCMFTNLAAMRSDPDLIGVYEHSSEMFDETYDLWVVDYGTAVYELYVDGVRILVTDSDSQELIQQLTESASNHRKMLDVDVWDWKNEIPQPAFEGVVAVASQYIAIGLEDAVRNWITFINADGSSIAAAPKFSNMLGRLNEGFIVSYSETLPSIMVCEGLQRGATVFSKKNSDSISYMSVNEFDSANHAKTAVPQIERAAMKSWDLQGSAIAANIEDNYLIVSVEFPISDFE